VLIEQSAKQAASEQQRPAPRQDRNVAAQAAKAVGASPRAVEQAARVAKVAPDLLEAGPTPPPNWLLASEVAELLDLASEVTIGRWRAAGRFGAEGVGWVKCGRSFYYAPEAVEELESSEVPAGLDDLLSEVRAA
jgi:hypothetical protein